MTEYAWVTLATNDSYSLGALVLAHSLRQVRTSHQLVCIITPGITDTMREKLRSTFDLVFEVNLLDSKDEANLMLMQRPELGVTFTKLHCWRLTQFKKCVFLDADTLVLQNCDELFEREEFSAAPDVGWPDCFNSGVFVYQPSEHTYNSLIQFALEHRSFDGGDQGLLNLYFSDWAHKDISRHLPFLYNMCSTACYSYLPAFKQFAGGVKIIHFIGATKPWLQYFNSETFQVNVASGMEHLQGIIQLWWNIFCQHVHSVLTCNMGGLAGALAQMTLGQPRSESQFALEDHLRRQGWEVGNIDYLGRDSFDNIWSKICQTMTSGPVQDTKSDQEQPRRKSPSPVAQKPQKVEEEKTVIKEVTAVVEPLAEKEEIQVAKPKENEKQSKKPVEEVVAVPAVAPAPVVAAPPASVPIAPVAVSGAETTEKPKEAMKKEGKTSPTTLKKTAPKASETPKSPKAVKPASAEAAASPSAAESKSAATTAPTPPPRKAAAAPKKSPKKKQ